MNSITRMACLLSCVACLALPLASRGSGQPSADAPPTIRVAIYAGEGAGEVEQVIRALEEDERFVVTKLDPEDVREGRLENFHVLIQPGGSGSGQAKSLGKEGRQKIRDFVERGGGYVGVCAGSYLASCDYEWSLGILDAKVLDRKHWARGFGTVEMSFSELGRSRLNVVEERLPIYYHQGPLLAPADNPTIEDYEPLAKFEGEIAKNGAPRGVMPGTTAIAAGRFGKGQVICFSPHPEKTAGQARLLVQAVVLASKAKSK